MPPTSANLQKQINALKKKVDKQKDQIATLKADVKLIEKWIKLEVKWSTEVTGMLQAVDWGKLQVAFPGGGGTNPPKTAPDWPPR